MRYLIITYDDYFNIPYIKYYEEHLRRCGQTYDIVLWSRSGQTYEAPDNHFVFATKDMSGKLAKILLFLRWRSFVLQELETRDYDRVVVLTTIPGVLLIDKLLGKYRRKYWFDIRDYTYEYFPLFKMLVKKLVLSSAVTSISSPAFRSFIPEFGRIVLAHNITNNAFEEEFCGLDENKKTVTIGFVGGIQYVQQNETLLRQFANHPGFCLKYVGKSHLGCDLASFARDNGIENAMFLPAYTNDQKPDIYRSIDMINSIYGGGSQIVKLALPNKLYDCIIFKKPIIVSKGTYLASIVEQYDLGLAVDIDSDSVVHMVEQYLASFDRRKFEEGCRCFLKKVMQEHTLYQQALNGFCAGEEIV